MADRVNSWSESDLIALIGQSESIRREFKSGRLFDGNQESKWVEQLSKEVSAFANTEGGELFLGIDEDKKSKPRVATSIDGVPSGIAPERLQQLIEGNVSPYLPGIRVNRVPLSSNPERIVFIIKIPQGSTAYQANDGRYYGRSEFEAKYLPDHEVRLRMSRGRVARGTVFARIGIVDLGVERERRDLANVEAMRAEEERRKKEGIPADLGVVGISDEGGRIIREMPNYRLERMSAQFLRDQVSFELTFRNDGELTIRSPSIGFREIRNARLFDERKVFIMNSVKTRKGLCTIFR
jgi:hypothetical protein